MSEYDEEVEELEAVNDRLQDRVEELEADNKALRLELEHHKDSPDKLKAWDRYVEIATEIYSKGNKDVDLVVEMLSLRDQYNFSPDKRVIGVLQQENKALRKSEQELRAEVKALEKSYSFVTGHKFKSKVEPRWKAGGPGLPPVKVATFDSQD